MDLNTTLYDCLVRHPEIESVQDIPPEDRRAILVAWESETHPALLVDILRTQGWDDDELAREDEVLMAAARQLSGNEEDIAEFRRLVENHIWRQAEEHIEEALQEVRAEEAA